MKKQSFIKGALILTIGGFVAKVLGAFYKIPLTNILGSSGMGIYYLVFPIYNFLLVSSSGGVSVAVSKLVANSQSEKLGKKYLFAGIVVSTCCSIMLALLLFLFSRNIAIFQGNDLSYLGFVVISPAIIFSSLIAIFKAYFQGIENMIPSTLSMIIEQVVKMVFGLIISAKLINVGIEYAVVGAVLGVTISEVVALLILIAQYVIHKRKEHEQSEDQKDITFKLATKQILSVSLPNTLMLLVVPLISFIDSFVVVNLLVDSGFSSISATSLYGINNGVVSSLISLPVIITSALSTAIVPNLSSLEGIRDKTIVVDRVRFFIKITWIISLPIFIYFFIMSNEIVAALFDFGVEGVINEMAFAGKLLMLSSISIIYNSLLSTLTSVLQAFNKAYSVFIIFAIGLILRCCLSFLLIQNQSINIFGVVISNLTFLFFCVCCCIGVLKQKIQLNIDIGRAFVIPIFVAAVSGGLTFLVSNILIKFNVWVNLLFSGITLVISYVILILMLKCFSVLDSKYLPFLARK